MNFGGEYSAHGPQFGQAARGPPIEHPRMALCPCPSRARGGVAAEDASCSERLTGSRRAWNHGRVMRVSRAGFPISPPSGGCHRGTTPSAPRRKPGSGASTEPSIELLIVGLAKHQVPRALAEPSSELPRRRIVNFVQPWSKLTILRSITTKTHDYLRYREAHARTIDKNVRSPLPRPRKTVCFDRQRPKPTVFRIAHPPRARARRRSGGAIPGGGAAPGQRSWPPERGPWPQGRGRGAELEGLMQTTRNQARLPLHIGTVNRA